MTPDLRLGYLVFGVRKPDAWQTFCTRMLGLDAPASNTDGSLGWRIDGAAHRLVVQRSDADDLVALGLECRDDAALDGVLARLEHAGIATQPAAPDLAQARRVRRLHLATDPAGNAVELFTGLEPAAGAFRSEAFPRGFVTGDLGIGHAVLVHDDLEAMEAFYTAIGFAVTERLATKVGPVALRGVFLHCNRRHHSLALFRLPSRKRLNHFMLQAADHADVGRAFERAKSCKVPLSLSLGQHPDPDGTFSFYGSTPSGFDFEIGAGTKTIEPAGREADRTSVTSTWGHEPQLRLKLRMAAAMVTGSVGR